MPKPPTIQEEATPLARAVHEAQVRAEVTMVTLGKHAVFLREMYRGRTREPGVDKLAYVARAFGTTLEQLRERARQIEGLSEKEADSDLERQVTEQADANRKLLLDLWGKLSEASQIDVLRYIISRLPKQGT